MSDSGVIALAILSSANLLFMGLCPGERSKLETGLTLSMTSLHFGTILYVFAREIF